MGHYCGDGIVVLDMSDKSPFAYTDDFAELRPVFGRA